MRPPLLSAFASLATLFATVPAHGADLDSSSDPATSAPMVSESDADSGAHDPRTFSGLGLHTHLAIGPAWGQQALSVETIDATSVATGASTPSTATAGGPGAATRMELWPAYGRFGAVGVFGEGAVGALRRQGGGTAMFVGSGGLTLMAGHPQLKVMLAAGRSRRASAYGSGTESASDVSQLSAASLDADSHYTAGSSDVRSHRAGVGLRAGFDGADRRGLDVWLLFDEPANGGPTFGVPSLSDSAMSLRSAIWLRNTLVVSGEVTLRPAQSDDPATGVAVDERNAMVTIGWSMDRFSRPY